VPTSVCLCSHATIKASCAMGNSERALLQRHIRYTYEPGRRLSNDPVAATNWGSKYKFQIVDISRSCPQHCHDSATPLLSRGVNMQPHASSCSSLGTFPAHDTVWASVHVILLPTVNRECLVWRASHAGRLRMLKASCSRASLLRGFENHVASAQ
jgi:hypothetical protein